MPIREEDVDDLLSRALPEFAPTVREHRVEWAEEPMLYLLVGSLFNLLVDSPKMAQASSDIVRRAYEIVEKAITLGTPGVRDVFAIEMIEPLAGDPHHEFYPNFESVMGPAALAELTAMREWGRRYRAMTATINTLNYALGRRVFQQVGIEGDNARVIADIEQWNRVDADQQRNAVSSLERKWCEFCSPLAEGSKPLLEVTGPVDTGFKVLLPREP